MLLYNGHAPQATRTLLVQFDGSYKPRTQRGGAGTAAFLVEHNRMQLLEWQAVAIAQCPDNIYAETIGYQQATLLAAQWYAKLAPDGPLHVVIQGDILPLIQYLNYNARLRYAGIQQHLIGIKHTALLELPNHTFAYLPREGNALADQVRAPTPHPLPVVLSSTPTSASLTPCCARQKSAMLPKSKPSPSTRNPMSTYHCWQQYPAHRMELARYLAKHTTSKAHAGHAVQYWRTSNDGKGRLYAQGPAVSSFFGRTHVEVDIIGAFYEIIRRTAATIPHLEPHRLPPMGQARAVLQQELHRQQPLNRQTAPAHRNQRHRTNGRPPPDRPWL